MEKTNNQKNLIFFSETIFSDRICNNIYQNANQSNIRIVYSNEVTELDKNLKDKSRNILFRLRVIIVRNLVEILKYVAPFKANDVALKDHFYIYSLNWKSHVIFLYKFAIFFLRWSHKLRKLIHKIIMLLIPKDLTTDIFSKFSDFNVVVFSVGNLKSLSVISFLAASKNFKNTKSFTFIQSWDNPTTKGYGSFRTDFVLTWTELMREEINLYQDIEFKKSQAVGSPSLLPEKILKRIVKKSSKNKSIKQKIIFATKSPASYKSNVDIAKNLAIFAHENNYDLEVRVHPLCLLRKSNELKQMINLSKEYNFYIRYPKCNDSGVMLDTENDNLAFSSKPSDILITVYSTMNIEAAYLGLKCINIDFATHEGKGFSPRVNIEFDRKQLHNKRILSYGYIYNVTSINDLIETIKKISNVKSNDLKIQRQREELIFKECMPVFDVESLLRIIT